MIREELIEIASAYGEYIANNSKQVYAGNKLQYYLCGSLATMLLSNATSVEKCEVSEKLLTASQEKIDIPQEARESLSVFSRQIHDIDIINVNGNMVNNSKVNVDGKIKNRMLRVPVQRAIPDIENLFKDLPSFYSAFANIDSLESERNIAKHRVAKIKIEEKEIYITSPEALIAHKLDETIQLVSQRNDLEKYNKNIKDLATMISGISKIYDIKELAKGIFDTIQEKENSHFNEHISELDNIFSSINKDIKSYIYEMGLDDRLSFSNITDVLGDVNISKENNQLRTDNTILNKHIKSMIEKGILIGGKVSTIDGFVMFQRVTLEELEQLEKNEIAFATQSMGRAIFQIDSDNKIRNIKGVDSHLENKENALVQLSGSDAMPITTDGKDYLESTHPINLLVQPGKKLDIRIRGTSPLEDIEIEADINAKMQHLGIKLPQIESVREYPYELSLKLGLPTKIKGSYEEFTSEYREENDQRKKNLHAIYGEHYEEDLPEGLRPEKVSEYFKRIGVIDSKEFKALTKFSVSTLLTNFSKSSKFSALKKNYRPR